MTNNLETDLQIEDGLIAVRGERIVGLGEKCEGIKKKAKLTDTDNSMGITRG